jgi:hypothetical protein
MPDGAVESSEPDPADEVVVGLTRLVAQARDGSESVTARITAAIAARNYLEAFTRRLVSEARESGSSWEEIAQLFGTSPMNARARFGDYRDYDD